MALFKCTSSGNIFEFKHEHDIQAMRKHPEYEEVNYIFVKEQEKAEPVEAQTEKKLGRPRKVKE